jgi:hypothetical protein
MARILPKVHLTRRGAPKLANPALGSLSDAMAAALAESADIEEPSIMSEVRKYLPDDGGFLENIRVF